MRLDFSPAGKFASREKMLPFPESGISRAVSAGGKHLLLRFFRLDTDLYTENPAFIRPYDPGKQSALLKKKLLPILRDPAQFRADISAHGIGHFPLRNMGIQDLIDFRVRNNQAPIWTWLVPFFRYILYS